MTTAETIDTEVREALDLETRPLFPSIYDGVREADALAQAEDALLGILCAAVYSYHQNRNLQTIRKEAAEALETGLDITPQGTLEERRAAIMRTLRKRSNISVGDLLELARQYTGEDVTIDVNPQTLTLKIECLAEETPFENVMSARAEIRRKAPQNLTIKTEVRTRGDIKTVPHITKPLVYLFANAGHAAGLRSITRGGVMTTTGDTAWTTPEWGILRADQ